MRGDPIARTKDVLIVEDDDRLREILEELLSGAGYRPIAVQDGREALDWLSRMPVDLMILDLLLPHLDGRQLIARVRKTPQWSAVPIIVLSGYAGASRYRDLPVQAVQTKPFELRELLGTIHQLIGAPGTDPGPAVDGGRRAG